VYRLVAASSSDFFLAGAVHGLHLALPDHIAVIDLSFSDAIKLVAVIPDALPIHARRTLPTC